jgi:hypothetical protein
MCRLPVTVAVVAALICACAAPARAHEFCVDSAAAIQGALTVAASNGEDDEIFIKSGEYQLNTALGTSLTFSSAEGHSLALYGSFDDLSVCPPDFTSGLHLAGAGTVLSGESLLRPLLINNSAGAITVLGLHFVAGVSVGPGGGLNIGAASVDLSFNRFDSNQATGAQGNGGGVAVAAVTGNINFSNNLLNGNQGTLAGAVRLYAANGSSTIRNNTIVANGTSTLSEPGGLKAEGPGSFDIQNNIVWNNHEQGGSDLGVFSTNTRSTNDIGVITPGSTSAGFTSDISVDPQFASCSFGPICLNFELARNSPLVDTGTDPSQKKGIDLAGKPRYIGPHVDIGAFENDRIFADRFGN